MKVGLPNNLSLDADADDTRSVAEDSMDTPGTGFQTKMLI